MNIYKREKYLRRLRGFFHDTEIIKVITGVRRCGKSCLMASIADELRETGIPDSQILFLDLDSKKYRKVKTPDQLDALIEGVGVGNETIYLFIDEVQNVKGFEEVINAYRTDGGYSIFITGSNSYLLSGELSTKLTGRYIELEMYPLSFDEYLGMKAFLGKPIQNNPTAEFDSYILEGGFPKALQYDSMEDKRTYTRSVISEIFEKDIRQRVKVRNKAVFESVQTYLLNNFGATTSLNNILKDLEKQGVHIKRETLNRYIKILQDAKILYRCNRFDLKFRRSLAGEQKYYLADCAFYFAMNTDNRINYGPVLENIVYTYARSQNYAVSIGRIGKLECDFILRDEQMQYAYVQVAMTIMNSLETEEREYRPLEQIADNYPKLVMTRSDMIQKRNGIRHVNLPEFIQTQGSFT